MRPRGVALGVVLAALACGTAAHAEDDAALFAEGTKALAEGRAGDAVADFEGLADRGVVDPVVSYDRGLAYAARVRVGGEQPGDLGRAAQGLEEARALSDDRTLVRDATQALSVVRAEVARRRARAGDPADVERGAGLGRSIVRLFPEDAWAVIALVASIALAVSLVLRGMVASRQGRAGAAIGWAVSAPLLVLAAGMTFAARQDRLTLRQGVVVSPAAHPADDKGIALPGAPPLPEAALVDIVATKPAWVRVAWGGTEAWLPSSAVRPLARPDAT